MLDIAFLFLFKTNPKGPIMGNLFSILILIAPSITSYSNEPFRTQQDQIRSEITKASTCKTKGDCKGPISVCPHGCNIYVNKKDYHRILKLLENSMAQCEYKCQHMENYACIKNQCQAQK